MPGHEDPTGYGAPPDGPGGPAGLPGNWQPAPTGRFENFRPDNQTGQPEQEPAPAVRNGRVLAAVLGAAGLLLVVPFAIVWLATGSDTPRFDVNSCVKQSGTVAVAASCTESGAFRVVSKVDNADQCPVKGQPTAVQNGPGGKKEVLCLKPAAQG